jgi:hypothetical protein
MTDEEKNKLEEVNEALYARGTDAIFAKRRHGLKEEPLPAKVGTAWHEEEKPEGKKINIPYQKIFLGALIFFFLALGVAFIKFFAGSNTVSGGNIDILLTGPVSISGGETLPLNVEVKNNNPVALQVVDLQIEFPAGTKSPDNLAQDLTRYAEILGDINPGQNATRLIKSVLYGPENTQEIIKVSVEYRLPGSNAIFSKEKDYTVLISSSPVNISVVGPSEVNANQSASFAINVTSNSLTTIKNLILKVDYPFGFNLTSSSIKPISANQDVFALGDMAPGSQVNLRIAGIFQGQSGEERVLTFSVGNPSATDNKSIGTPFAVFSQSVSLNNPSMGLATLINQDSSPVVSVSPGNKVETDISWQNNLAENLYNVSIKVSLVGAMLDRTSVFANNGFYNSADNSVTFDKSTISDFDTVAPGGQGGVNFNWATLVPSPGASDQFNNSSVVLNITATGLRNGEATPEVLFSDSRTVKISSGLSLLSRGYRTSGPFENTAHSRRKLTKKVPIRSPGRSPIHSMTSMASKSPRPCRRMSVGSAIRVLTLKKWLMTAQAAR